MASDPQPVTLEHDVNVAADGRLVCDCGWVATDGLMWEVIAHNESVQEHALAVLTHLRARALASHERSIHGDGVYGDLCDLEREVIRLTGGGE